MAKIKKKAAQEEIFNPFGDSAQFVKNEKGDTVSVTLDIATFHEIVEALSAAVAMQAAMEMFADFEDIDDISEEAVEEKLLGKKKPKKKISKKSE